MHFKSRKVIYMYIILNVKETEDIKCTNELNRCHNSPACVDKGEHVSF